MSSSPRFCIIQLLDHAWNRYPSANSSGAVVARTRASIARRKAVDTRATVTVGNALRTAFPKAEEVAGGPAWGLVDTAVNSELLQVIRQTNRR